MDIQRIQLSEIQEIERNAIKLALSFYDASYYTKAKTCERTLVTEDERLHNAAKETGAPCLHANEITNTRSVSNEAARALRK